MGTEVGAGRGPRIVQLLPSKLDDWLSWMRRARNHAEQLCRCFPAPEKAGGDAPRIAEWAKRWPQDYLEAKSRAEKSLKKIETAIEAIQRAGVTRPSNDSLPAPGSGA